jgi:hypothetical protein
VLVAQERRSDDSTRVAAFPILFIIIDFYIVLLTSFRGSAAASRRWGARGFSQAASKTRYNFEATRIMWNIVKRGSGAMAVWRPPLAGGY